MPKNKYSEENILKNRTFPVKNTVLLIICIIAQIALIIFAILYSPKPIDFIKNYNVTVAPASDGRLLITYDIEWLALSDEPLTWVDIGLPNENVSMDKNSVSENISSYHLVDEDGYVALRIYFDRGYRKGQTVEFSFRIIQGNMLCKNQNVYFYEFIPSWFNEIPVENFEFKWLKTGTRSSNALVADENHYVWSGSLACGEYRTMQVFYQEDTFSGCKTVKYKPFDDDGAYNELKEDKTGSVVFCVILCGIIAIFEVIIIDSYVSYEKGRGFITGYGHRMHVYGRVNPHYIRARDLHSSSSGRGGGRSGGCACACACACAGGGRAGCSQKDFNNIKK